MRQYTVTATVSRRSDDNTASAISVQVAYGAVAKA